MEAVWRGISVDAENQRTSSKTLLLIKDIQRRKWKRGAVRVASSLHTRTASSLALQTPDQLWVEQMTDECGDRQVAKQKEGWHKQQPTTTAMSPGSKHKMMTQTLCVNWDYSKTCKHSETIMPTSILKKQKNKLLTKEFQPLWKILLSNVTNKMSYANYKTNS